MLCRQTSDHSCWLHMQLKHEASKSAMHRESERVMDATCGCMQTLLHKWPCQHLITCLITCQLLRLRMERGCCLPRL